MCVSVSLDEEEKMKSSDQDKERARRFEFFLENVVVVFFRRVISYSDCERNQCDYFFNKTLHTNYICLQCVEYEMNSDNLNFF